MHITPLSIDPAALHLGDSGAIRASGLHASTIYNSLYQDLEPDRYKVDAPMNPLLLETGIIFEDILEEGLQRRYVEHPTGNEYIERPAPLAFSDVWDGKSFTLTYSPDLFIYNHILRVGEIKATWLSSHIEHDWLKDVTQYEDNIREAIMGNQKLDKYWCQLKFYMHMIGTRFGRLYACFIAGDYSRPFKSQLVTVDVEFSEDELESNYGMLMNHAIHRKLI